MFEAVSVPWIMERPFDIGAIELFIRREFEINHSTDY